MNKLYQNSLLITCFISFYGAVIYYLYQLNYLGIFLTLFLSIITFILLNKGKKVKNEIIISSNSQSPTFNKNWLLVAGCWLLLILNLSILLRSATTKSIISPWEVIPSYFWIIFILNLILLVTIILKTKLSSQIILLLVAGCWLLVTSIALVVYTVGFGFDPFIHEATEKLIAAQGFVNPKPLYYLGQYSLIITLHKILFIPISILNIWLVPVLASIFLPPALFSAVKNLGAENKTALLSTLFILIFPFSFFTITTPQNLAYLFLILLILLSIEPAEKLFNSKFLILNSLALATAAVHPIAGIPAILFVTMLWSKKIIKNKKFVTCYLLLVTCVSVIALPTAFYLNNKTNSVISSSTTDELSPFWQLPKLFFSGQENFLLNFLYLYGFNIEIIIIFFIIFGIWATRKKIFNIKYSILNIYLLMSIALLISYFMTKFINFSYLINYERSDFANRILLTSIFFTLPFILISLLTLIKKIIEQEKIVKYSMLCFFIFLLSCSLYISYPRFDNYFNSRSYSTSQSDIDAVNWIAENAKNDNFIVLANQQISAAALKKFGFKKYYHTENGEIFYYPIPTGEKLYQYYLKMVYEKADKKTALEAADLVGADTVYFVLNNYWWAYDKILAEAKIEADEIKNINNNIYIFKYKN